MYSLTCQLLHVWFELLLPDLYTCFSDRLSGLVFPFFKNFPQFVVIHRVKGFSVVNEAELDVFLDGYIYIIITCKYILHITCNYIYENIDFPGGSDSKESACNAGNLSSITGLGRSPAEENICPLQYSCLENSMDRGAWRATVHGVTKSQT